ncbi:putative sulfate transporter [Leptomonas seymouri]|uniref:Putative sulfate transporter n=1 Tax=Leptomonas seymouri TaxID=5684 RepID=A0A0N0P5Z3_LEPSE|nr:putative sulfate transporter [Leptomonas seymouri]|eukprot:KPI87036.1 putative sulfate transporter [Leptomonas seymouri]
MPQHSTLDLDVGEEPIWMPPLRTSPVSSTAVAPNRSCRGSKIKRFCTWYLSCLCTETLEGGGGAGGDSSSTNNEAMQDGVSGSEGAAAAPSNSATIQQKPPSKNPGWLMRFLLVERWSDGSLIAVKTDVFAGITLAVAQVAPSVAFALMGHGEPLVGLYSSFFLGIIACVFGGRPGQITAIAGAVVVLYPNLVDKHGYGAACAVSVIAGCFLLLPGIFRFARLVRLLPSSLMVGFCNGLGLSMVVHQIPQFKRPDGNYVTGTQALYTAIICVITYAVMMLMPYFTTIIPSAFVAIVVGTAIEYIFQLGTVTIGDLYQLHGDFPKPMVPNVAWTEDGATKDVMLAAVLTAIISAVESFMSGYKIQQLTETPTNFERESLALGAAHIVNGFFQGMPGCVVFGPCILNIECGAGTRRLSSFICAVLMAVIPLALYSVISIVPMGALSAVLFGVSSKTADWRMLAMIFLQRISFQESVVAIVVTVVTVVSDLAIGAASGLAAALVFFMWNMARGRVQLMPMEYRGPAYVSAANAPTAAESTAASSPPPMPAQKVGTTLVSTVAAPPATANTEPMDATTAGAVARELAEAAADLCFSGVAAEAEEAHEKTPPSLTLGESTTVVVPSGAPPPVLNRSIVGNPCEARVNFLDVIHDETFPEIRVLRINLHGVLFFGSSMEFVDGMVRMLHDHHSEIFLKVTDFILDFQHGLMPVLDFSAAEAIQDTAHILAKRGIRTHVQNMDPLSWACFDRIRRYFPDVCEDDVNNVKQHCYVRRVFKIVSRRDMQEHNTHADELDDDVFLRGSRIFARSAPAAAVARDAQDEKGGETGPSVAPSSFSGTAPTGLSLPQNREPDLQAVRAELIAATDTAAASGAGEQGVQSDVAPAADTIPLSAIEECLPLSETVKVGFPIFRPDLGITVPVFDTISHWARRTVEDIQAGRTPALEIGLTSKKPIDRQFGDVGKLWWMRLVNLDIPAWVRDGMAVPETLHATTQRSPEVPLRRLAPECFEQVARFPGQGFAKGERLHRDEWKDVQSCVYRQVFATEPPATPNRFAARMRQVQKELVGGFI